MSATQELNIDALANNFIARMRNLPKITVAVVYPCSADALCGAIEAAQLGNIEPILIGPRQKMLDVAKEEGLDITPFTMLDIAHPELAAEKAVLLIHEGKADAIMKGSLHTDELMRQVVNKEGGLRTRRRISHVFIMAVKNYHKPFIITDAAININPDLITKRDIIQNAIDLMYAIDKTKEPKVAVLSAVETVNPQIPSTIDAACLAKMAERGQITGAIIDGPLAYDNVMSLAAAQTKNIQSPVIGDTDIFVVPNLEAGNILAKQLALMNDAVSAGIILGAAVPIILTSRADQVRSRVGSCAVAVLMVNAKREAQRMAEQSQKRP
jgi:phosphate acetyltransferase/phosphate butyryltransferase